MPKRLFPPVALWKTEQRVGLARNHDRPCCRRRSAYTARSMCGSCEALSWLLAVEGIPEGLDLPDLIALGGESRMAQCESQADELPLPELPDDMIRESNRFTVSLLSPLFLPRDSSGRLASPMPGQTFPGLAGSTVVSACVGRPVHIGGWNSLKPRTVAAHSSFAARINLVLRGCPCCRPDSVLALHGRHVGERRPYGFGQIALGAWPQETGDVA